MVQALVNNGHRAEAIHADKTQRARQKALKNFKERKTRILVATDIAARGIDISELSHVINYNLPEVPETYVHRIGRTGRSGHHGIALSFVSNNEKSMLRGIQQLTGKKLEEVTDHPYPLKDKSSGSGKNNKRGRRRRPSSGQGQGPKQGQGADGKNKKSSKRRSNADTAKSAPYSKKRGSSRGKRGSSQGRSAQSNKA